MHIVWRFEDSNSQAHRFAIVDRMILWNSDVTTTYLLPLDDAGTQGERTGCILEGWDEGGARSSSKVILVSLAAIVWVS